MQFYGIKSTRATRSFSFSRLPTCEHLVKTATEGAATIAKGGR